MLILSIIGFTIMTSTIRELQHQIKILNKKNDNLRQKLEQSNQNVLCY